MVVQSDLARAMGLHQSTISWWERGMAAPTIRHRLELARVLGGKPDDYLPTFRGKP
jgi:transcriptional regulator with XRE-family HTH domain